jgi:hypothetical protein
MKRKISKRQYEALNVILNGGTVFHFTDDNTVGLDDVDGNTIAFSKSTFLALRIRKLIEFKSQLAIDCEEWGITTTGHTFITNFHDAIKIIKQTLTVGLRISQIKYGKRHK